MVESFYITKYVETAVSGIGLWFNIPFDPFTKMKAFKLVMSRRLIRAFLLCVPSCVLAAKLVGDNSVKLVACVDGHAVAGSWDVRPNRHTVATDLAIPPFIQKIVSPTYEDDNVLEARLPLFRH